MSFQVLEPTELVNSNSTDVHRREVSESNRNDIESREAPKPAPRRLNSASSEPPTTPKQSSPPLTTSQEQSQNNHKQTQKAPSQSSLEDEQVLFKPITNEEFQAMIPPHFLKQSAQKTHPNCSNGYPPNSNTALATSCENIANSITTVTIKKPDPIVLPPAPTGLGKVTETITKSTLTETVVTRITDNKFVAPLIIEVGSCYICS